MGHSKPLLVLGAALALTSCHVGQRELGFRVAGVVDGQDLRTQIETANMMGGGTIGLIPNQEYTLSDVLHSVPSGPCRGATALPSITSQIVIQGGGAIVQRDELASDSFRLFHIAAAGELTLEDVTVRNGSLPGEAGGGICNEGSTELTRSSVVDNQAEFGGGVYNHNRLALTRSSVRRNSARVGGGIYNRQGDTLAVDSRLAENLSSFAGGGLTNEARLSLLRSTVSNNSAGYDLHGDVVDTSALGGGIASASAEPVRLANSTISGNQAALQGGGLLFIPPAGPTTLSNLTVTMNSVGMSKDMSIATSAGGGVFSSVVNAVTLKNTLVAGNQSVGTTAATGPDCSGAFTSSGHNLLGSSADCTLSAGTGDRSGMIPLLGPLANNGGPTETHALLPGSPGIDGVGFGHCSDVGGQPLLTDQRGIVRPDGAGGPSGLCDIGAYELMLELDRDGDGLPDIMDACPDSLLGPSVVLGSCDAGVPNPLLHSGRYAGCTLADLVLRALFAGGEDAAEALLERLEDAGRIDEAMAEAIEECLDDDGDPIDDEAPVRDASSQQRN